VGRFGWNRLKLPRVVIVLELLLLLTVALTSPLQLPGRARALAVGVVAASIVAIVIGQYVIWTIVCAEVIEGVQGRYFLPLAVLLLSALSLRPKPVPPSAIIAVSVICNVIALLTLVRSAW
jgi:uncharacterized membrane protein